MQFTIEEVDTLRGGQAHNLLDPSVRARLLGRIRAGEFDMVLIAPMQHIFQGTFRQPERPTARARHQSPQAVSLELVVRTLHC